MLDNLCFIIWILAWPYVYWHEGAEKGADDADVRMISSAIGVIIWFIVARLLYVPH